MSEIEQQSPSPLRLALMLCIGAVVLLLATVVVAAVAYVTRSAPEAVLPSDDVLQWQRYQPIEPSTEPLVITEAPLFWYEREPYIAPVEQVEEPPAPRVANKELNNAKLLGVFYGDGASSVIIKKGSEEHRVALMGTFRGWQLVSLGFNSARFKSPDITGDDDLDYKTLTLTKREPLSTTWERSDTQSLNEDNDTQ